MGAPQLDNVSDSEFIGLELRLRKTLKDAGGASSLTHSILSMLINKSYSHASKEIDMYLELKSEYPQLAEFTKRYVDRAKHIIEDIEERRNIPTENMSMTKVQAIHDGIVDLFDSLKVILKKIEKVAYNQRMTDLRSTLIIVRTFSWCILAIIGMAFFMEVYNGLYSTTGSVADEMITEAVDWVFKKID